MSARLLLAALCLTLISASEVNLAGPFAPDHPLSIAMSDSQKIALEAMAEQPIPLHPALLSVASDVPLMLRITALWQDFELAIEPIEAGYDDAERAALQDLLRHPGLFKTMLEAGAEGEAPLRHALEAYPVSIREVALAAGLEHRAVIEAIAAHVDTAVAGFEMLIASHPEGTREAYRAVIGRPLLFDEMVEHLDVTEMLAGSARIDLEGTLAGLAGLHGQVERRRAEAAAELARREAARREAERQQAARRRAERRARLDRGHYWGASSCWGGAGAGMGRYSMHRWGGVGRRCWYPWHRYGRRWW